MKVITIRVGTHALGIVASTVSELMRRERKELVEMNEGWALPIDDEIIQILDLHDSFNIPRQHSTPNPRPIIVIVKTGIHSLGLLVDELIEVDDMVVYPLPPQVNPMKLMLGATIRGHREVLSIINASALLRHSQLQSRPIQSDVDRQSTQHILLVDDSFNTREIARSILETSGYETKTAANGSQALELMNQFEFDLVVTDVEMPIMNGFELTRRIKAHPRFQEVPVVLLTSRDSKEDRLKGIESGADAYLVKRAFEQSRLLGTIQNLID